MTDKDPAIIKTAIELFANDGTAVPLATVSRQCNMSNDEFAKHFNSKQELFDEIFFALRESIANDIIPHLNLDTDIKTILFDIWSSYIDWACDNIRGHQVLGMLRSSGVLSADIEKTSTDHFFAVAFETLEKGQEEDIIIEQPLDYMTSVAIAFMRSTIDYIYHHKLSDKHKKNLIRDSFDMYWKGIRIQKI